MEEEWPLKLIKFVKEVWKVWYSGYGKCDIFDFRFWDSDAIFDDVEVWVGHDHYELVAHVFDLDLEAGAETCVPFLLNSWITYLINVLGIDFEIEREGCSLAKRFLFKLRYRNTETEQHSFYGLARKETFDIWTHDFNFDLSKAAGNWNKEHLVDWIVEDFRPWFALTFILSFQCHKSIFVKTNNLARSHDKRVTGYTYKERVWACQVFKRKDL